MKDHEIREKINELRDIAINLRDAQQLRERIAHAIVDHLKEIQPLREWKEAVIDEGVCCHIGWDETNPRKSLQDIISWHVAVALDPAVSSAAQALIEQGREEAALPGVEVQTIAINCTRTGRTTRMLNEAIDFARLGRAVYVVARNDHHAKLLRHHLLTILHPLDHEHMLGIKIEPAWALSNLDWHTLKLKGAHPNCKVFVDHFAIEDRFAAILEMLHRYDE